MLETLKKCSHVVFTAVILHWVALKHVVTGLPHHTRGASEYEPGLMCSHHGPLPNLLYVVHYMLIMPYTMWCTPKGTKEPFGTRPVS